MKTLLVQNYKLLLIVGSHHSIRVRTIPAKKNNLILVEILTNIDKVMKKHSKACDGNFCPKLNKSASTCVKCNFRSTLCKDCSFSSSLANLSLKSPNYNEPPEVTKSTHLMSPRLGKNSTTPKRRKTTKIDGEP